VHPEACIAAQIAVAQRLGAELRTDEQVTGWENCGEGVRVTTDKSQFTARRLVLCAGSWLPGIVPELAKQARVYRQVLFWFGTNGPHERFAPEQMPVFIRVPDCGTAMFYGFPAINGPDGGVKIAGEQFEHTSAPDDVNAAVTPDEIAAMQALAAPHLPITSRCVRTVVCKYTVTPDFGFVVDRHPDSDRVWLASACSGHGFKHSAAIGEALAETSLEGRTRFDLSAFRQDRFVNSAPSSTQGP
jgi:sarcosine oxidase